MYLLGASGHAKVIIDILELNKVKVEGLFDKNDKIKELNGYSVRFESELPDSCQFLISVGNNKIRKELAEKLVGYDFLNAIHPQAVIANSVSLGVGIAVMANAVVNSDTCVGNHVIINTSASVDHDCIIKDFAHVAPNATLTGGVFIGEGALIGAGSVILPNVKIGKWSIIGAGTVVIKDVPDFCTLVGNPGNIINVQ